jgi:hypothetical protein
MIVFGTPTILFFILSHILNVLGCCVNMTSLQPGLLKDGRAFEADLKALSEAGVGGSNNHHNME